jgi:cysteine-S-conjugate beta-lyase
MKYNFDEIIPRKNTHSVKWDFLVRGEQFGAWEEADPALGDRQMLPMWVADMDFPVPAPVVEALKARAEHGIFGYTAPTASYFDAVVSWMKRKQGWDVQADWIVTCPGIVPALNFLVQTFVSPGDKVIVQRPVYYPFMHAVSNHGATLVVNSLTFDAGGYQMDFADLEEKASDPDVRMMILCSPHNPVGRIWRRKELARVADICVRNNVLLVSDEIHADLIMPGERFTPLGALSADLWENAIICTAPSKTFNIAGLHTSNIIIPNPELRRRFRAKLNHNGLFGSNPFGLVALEAAYNEGEEWLAQVLEYINANYRFLEEFCQTCLPKIHVMPLEATYLAWLDCRALKLNRDSLDALFFDEARLYLDSGHWFGQEGEGFQRINLACPRSVLEKALTRLEAALRAREG